MSTTIRPAGVQDEFALLALRNEPAVRAWSSTHAPITEDVHSVWFRRAIVDRSKVVLVADAGDGDVVAYGRLEPAMMVSFAVARGQRGRGLGQEMLVALADAGRSRGVRELVAHVHPGNGPSLGAFAAQGYEMRDIVQVVRRGL